MRHVALVGALLVTLIGAPSALAQVDADAPTTVWLCRPGLADNPCDLSRTATVLKANGTETVQKAKAAKKPPIDCFYVYPTVSGQLTPNANLDIECAQADGASWLQINRVAAPGDDRPQVQNVLGPTWGLHLVDVSLALGNLVDLVRTQSQAFSA